ncbi:MAG: hypothetical protein LH628_03625 [Microcoleus sp. CAN_BIN18]|nr:hypothetical protein [Microcoleus sp. CAN_BIN18]
MPEVEGSKKKEEGRRKKEEGRRKKEEGPSTTLRNREEGRKKLCPMPCLANALFGQFPIPCLPNAQCPMPNAQEQLSYYHGEPTFRWTLSNY